MFTLKVMFISGVVVAALLMWVISLAVPENPPIVDMYNSQHQDDPEPHTESISSVVVEDDIPPTTLSSFELPKEEIEKMSETQSFPVETPKRGRPRKM